MKRINRGLFTLAVLGFGMNLALAEGDLNLMSRSETNAIQEVSYFSGNQNYFAQLEVMFHQSGTPLLKDLQGWHTGRCFVATAPGVPRNGLLVIQKSASADAGPAFPPGEAFKFFGAQYSDGHPADYFDLLTHEKASEWKTFIETEITRVPETVRFENGWRVNYNSSTVWDVVQSSEGYLVFRWLNQGKTHAYCYFFRRVFEEPKQPENPCLIPGVPFPPGCADPVRQ